MPEADPRLAKVLAETTQDEALLDIISLSACAGGVAKEELEIIFRMARQLPSCAGLSDEELDAEVLDIVEKIERELCANDGG